jgi:hypothetical protein
VTRLGSSRDNIDSSIAAHENAHVTTQKVEISERTLSVIAFGFGVAAFITSLWCIHDAEITRQIAQRERQETREENAAWHADVNREVDRLVHEVNVGNIYYQNHDALLFRAGIKQPGDMPRGPTGNLEYHPPKEN